KKGDLVVVIAGKDAEIWAGNKKKTTRGRVLKVFPDRDRVLVEGVNIVKRHQRANTPGGGQGGIVEREAPIHLSNVMLVDPKTDKPTRIRMGVNKDGKKVRIAVKSGTVLDG